MNQPSTYRQMEDDKPRRQFGVGFVVWATLVTVLLLFNSCMTCYLVDYVHSKQRIETIFKASKSR